MSTTQAEESLFIDSDFTYQEFLDQEEIPVHGGHALDDVRTAAVDSWERTGARGAIVQFE
jgi:hypothetical protein